MKLFQLTAIALAALTADYLKTKICGSYDFPDEKEKDNKEEK